MEEKWLPIEGYIDMYEISSFGQLRTLERMVDRKSKGKMKKCGRIMRFTPGPDGYCRVALWKKGKCSLKYVHRLVANAFLKNEQQLPEVNHKDCVRNNNRVENLEWVSKKQNMAYASSLGHMRKPHKGLEKLNKSVNQFEKNGTFLKKWPSLKEAATIGISSSSICLAAQGKIKSAGGYKWEYV